MDLEPADSLDRQEPDTLTFTHYTHSVALFPFIYNYNFKNALWRYAELINDWIVWWRTIFTAQTLNSLLWFCLQLHFTCIAPIHNREISFTHKVFKLYKVKSHAPSPNIVRFMHNPIDNPVHSNCRIQFPVKTATLRTVFILHFYHNYFHDFPSMFWHYSMTIHYSIWQTNTIHSQWPSLCDSMCPLFTWRSRTDPDYLHILPPFTQQTPTLLSSVCVLCVYLQIQRSSSLWPTHQLTHIQMKNCFYSPLLTLLLVQTEMLFMCTSTLEK